MAVHVRYNSWHISSPSSAKQQRKMTKFRVVQRTCSVRDIDKQRKMAIARFLGQIWNHFFNRRCLRRCCRSFVNSKILFSFATFVTPRELYGRSQPPVNYREVTGKINGIENNGSFEKLTGPDNLPGLHTYYKHFCLASTVTAELFGDYLSEQVKDISEVSRVRRKVTTSTVTRHKGPTHSNFGYKNESSGGRGKFFRTRGSQKHFFSWRQTARRGPATQNSDKYSKSKGQSK